MDLPFKFYDSDLRRKIPKFFDRKSRKPFASCSGLYNDTYFNNIIQLFPQKGCHISLFHPRATWRFLSDKTGFSGDVFVVKTLLFALSIIILKRIYLMYICNIYLRKRTITGTFHFLLWWWSIRRCFLHPFILFWTTLQSHLKWKKLRLWKNTQVLCKLQSVFFTL